MKKIKNRTLPIKVDWVKDMEFLKLSHLIRYRQSYRCRKLVLHLVLIKFTQSYFCTQVSSYS